MYCVGYIAHIEDTIEKKKSETPEMDKWNCTVGRLLHHPTCEYRWTQIKEVF